MKPVDGPDGEALLAAAIAGHDSPDVETLARSLDYRDSPWSSLGYSAMDNLVYGRETEIEAAGVPLYVVTGWLDAATTDGALARFASFSNRQTVHVAPLSHGGGHDTDPFDAVDAPPVFSEEEQLERLERFFTAYLEDGGEPPPAGLAYHVMGADVWKRTEVWPPEGFETRIYHLAGDGRLALEPPTEAGAADTYPVDFDVGTAESSRWKTQLRGSDVVYDRRAATAPRLATYTSRPFDRDMELTGTVVASLWLTSDRSDGALHAYLEDVAPDGTVRYLSEGVLRLEHRRVADGPPLYPTFGPYHSFLEKDAAPMPAGEPQRVALGLYATSALIRRGHRLRITIAGADATSFARVPPGGPAPEWTIHRGARLASTLEVPLRSWEPLE